MKTSLLIAASALLAVNAYAAAPATVQQKAPRTVEVSATAAPPIIRTSLNESTLLELPAEEKVATVFGGNTDDWIFNAGHVASRFIVSVRATTPSPHDWLVMDWQHERIGWGCWAAAAPEQG